MEDLCHGRSRIFNGLHLCPPACMQSYCCCELEAPPRPALCGRFFTLSFDLATPLFP